MLLAATRVNPSCGAQCIVLTRIPMSETSILFVLPTSVSLWHHIQTLTPNEHMCYSFVTCFIINKNKLHFTVISSSLHQLSINFSLKKLRHHCEVLISGKFCAKPGKYSLPFMYQFYQSKNKYSIPQHVPNVMLNKNNCSLPFWHQFLSHKTANIHTRQQFYPKWERSSTYTLGTSSNLIFSRLGSSASVAMATG